MVCTPNRPLTKFRCFFRSLLQHTRSSCQASWVGDFVVGLEALSRPANRQRKLGPKSNPRAYKRETPHQSPKLARNVSQIQIVLNYICACLHGGLKAAITLAWLSRDSKVRQM